MKKLNELEKWLITDLLSNICKYSCPDACFKKYCVTRSAGKKITGKDLCLKKTSKERR